MVEYDSGERTSVALSASAGAVDVCLSTPSLQLEPAYIGLCSQKTLKIVNRSEIPVKFSWKAFATVNEEEVRTKGAAGEGKKRCIRPKNGGLVKQKRASNSRRIFLCMTLSHPRF